MSKLSMIIVLFSLTIITGCATANDELAYRNEVCGKVYLPYDTEGYARCGMELKGQY